MTNELIADAHTHVFNAGFLPIEGILMSRGVQQEVARAITDFIENRVERDWPPPAPSRASESERRRQLLYEMLEQELISPSEVATSSVVRIVLTPACGIRKS